MKIPQKFFKLRFQTVQFLKNKSLLVTTYVINQQSLKHYLIDTCTKHKVNLPRIVKCKDIEEVKTIQ